MADVFTNIPGGSDGAGYLRVATAGDLPVTAEDGDLAITEDTGDLYTWSGGAWAIKAGSGGGTVTSVALSMPAAVFNIAGSPVTGSGTLAVTFDTQTANSVFSGPASGAAASPTFRALVEDDIPSLPASKITDFADEVNDAIAFPLNAPNGSLGAPSFGFAADGDTGIFSTGDGNFSVGANGILNFEANQNTFDVFRDATFSSNVDVTGDISAANFPPTGNTNSWAGYDGSGDLYSVPDFFIDANSGGMGSSITLEPNNVPENLTVHSSNVNVNPIQDSPADSVLLHNIGINLDTDNDGFEFGTGGQAATVMSLYLNHNGSSDVGGLSIINTGVDIGNGTDPLTINGLGYVFGFGGIDNNVTINGALQGYGFQPNVASGAIGTSNFSGRAFYDGLNCDIPMEGYASFVASPSIAAITNNHGANGIDINPNIDEMQGNSNYNAVAISGNIGLINTGGYTGVNLNTTITENRGNATGLAINMDNVTNYAGVQATLTIQDLTYTWNQPGSFNNGYQIEYLDDVTAGNETLSIAGMLISVHMEDGVSTATQIKAAADANLSFVANVTTTISGVGGNAQTAVGPTNFADGENAGSTKAAQFDGDVSIDGALTFSGALSVGKLSAFAQQTLVDGGGAPGSVHQLISSPTIGDNQTLTTADTLGINTAALINIGTNSSVSTAFLGIAALGLPAVLSMGTGSTVDRVSGALFALSLDASAPGGTADTVDLCRALAIPNGATTVNKLRGYTMQLPFGDVGTDQWGVYIEPDAYNWLKGSLKIGGTAGSTDFAASGVGLHVEAGDTILEQNLEVQGDVGFFGITPQPQPVSSGPATAGAVYTATEQAMLQEAYDALRSLGLMS